MFNEIKSYSSTLYLDVSFLLSFGDMICVEIIVRFQILPSLLSCPLHILFSSTIILVVIYQAKYQMHSISPGLRYDEIQALHQIVTVSKCLQEKKNQGQFVLKEFNISTLNMFSS